MWKGDPSFQMLLLPAALTSYVVKAEKNKVQNIFHSFNLAI